MDRRFLEDRDDLRVFRSQNAFHGYEVVAFVRVKLHDHVCERMWIVVREMADDETPDEVRRACPSLAQPKLWSNMFTMPIAMSMSIVAMIAPPARPANAPTKTRISHPVVEVVLMQRLHAH